VLGMDIALLIFLLQLARRQDADAGH